MEWPKQWQSMLNRVVLDLSVPVTMTMAVAVELAVEVEVEPRTFQWRQRLYRFLRKSQLQSAKQRHNCSIAQYIAFAFIRTIIQEHDQGHFSSKVKNKLRTMPRLAQKTVSFEHRHFVNYLV